MADIIARLKLDSGEYDNKIKRATQGLLQMEQECRKAGTSLNNISKNNMEYVRSLGQMQTVSNTARGKLNELSSAFTELSVRYKHLTDEEKKGEYGKTLSASLDQLKVRIEATKNDLLEVDEALGKVKNSSQNLSAPSAGGGSLFSLDKLSGSLQVFAGNMMSRAADLAIGKVQELVGELKQAVDEGIEMARAGEGIINAFKRLNNPELLGELRKATHGTVNDLELMKAAVKFNDFKLPVKELGSMLAFAQQKAKDTGQSVDYMVDSIVTGLGRKSLMILDNLGLSANEIKEKMKETGDMTTAVGAIIREQMSDAGGYVETAADRAAKSTADVENAMLELGQELLPLKEQSEQLWATFEVGALNAMRNLIPVINDVAEGTRVVCQVFDDLPPYIKAAINPASALLEVLKNIGPEGKTAFMMIADFAGKTLNPLYAVLRALRLIGHEQRNIGSNGSGGSASGGGGGSTGRGGGGIRGGDDGTTPPKISLGGGGGGNRRTGRTGSKTTPPPAPEGSIERQSQKIQELQKAWRYAADDESREKIKKQIDEMREELDRMEGKNVFPLGSMAQINAMLSDIAAKQKLVTDPDDWQKLEDAAAKYRDELAKIKGTYADPAAIKDKLQTTDLVVAPVSLGLDEKEMEAFGKKIKDYFKKNPLGDAGKSVTEEWQNAAKAIQAVGSAMSGIEDPAAKVLGTIAQAVATIALGYAEATKQAATMGPWAWVAFAATGLATMISSISAVKSATSGYAQGGIVPGNSYSGDLLSTRDYGINSGELILNKAQQGIIASQLEGGGMQGMVLDTQISAEAIRIVLNNNGRRTRRGEYVTTKKYGS